MAISGSTDFNQTRTQLIDGALRAIGVLRSGDTVENDSTLESDCAESLNLMLKSWQTLGIQLWVRKDETITWLEDVRVKTVKYPGGDVNIAQPLRIVHANRRDSSNIDTPMISMTKDEYNKQSSKFATGTPVQYYYDVGLTEGNLYVWPVPTSNTNVVITYHDQFDDMDSNINTPEFPSSWLEAVKFNLAIRLAPEFGISVPQEVAALAGITLENAQAEGYEEGSLWLRPNRKGRR